MNTLKTMRKCQSSYCTSCFKDRKSTRLNSSHLVISYAVFCLKKKKIDVFLSIRLEPGGRLAKVVCSRPLKSPALVLRASISNRLYKCIMVKYVSQRCKSRQTL